MINTLVYLVSPSLKNFAGHSEYAWSRPRAMYIHACTPLLCCCVQLFSSIALLLLERADHSPLSPTHLSGTPARTDAATHVTAPVISRACNSLYEHVHLSRPYIAPAFLYALNNNLLAHMQIDMDPATFQVSQLSSCRGLCLPLFFSHSSIT